MTIIEDIDGFGGSKALPATQKNQSDICQIVITILVEDALRANIIDRLSEREISADHARKELSRQIIHKSFKPVTEYLEKQGIYYQIDVQDAEIYIPNISREISREIIKQFPTNITRFDELRRGNRFVPRENFDGIKLY